MNVISCPAQALTLKSESKNENFTTVFIDGKRMHDNEIKDIQDLIEDVNTLSLYNFRKIELIKTRLDDTIKRVFGDSSKYSKDSEKIVFPKDIQELDYLTSSSVQIALFVAFNTPQLEKSKEKMLYLLDTMKRTLELKECNRNSWRVLKEESIGIGQRPKAERIIKDWLEQVNDEVSFWLNYIDETTISYLNNLPRACKIRIMTSEIQNNSKFMKEASKLGKVYPKLEVKLIRVNAENQQDEPTGFSEGERAIIHKRRLISSNTIIDFGTDLKTSALGNTKYNMVLMEGNPSIKKEFDMEWNREEAEWARIEGIFIKMTYHEWGIE